jgi:hypothetical protein
MPRQQSPSPARAPSPQPNSSPLWPPSQQSLSFDPAVRMHTMLPSPSGSRAAPLPPPVEDLKAVREAAVLRVMNDDLENALGTLVLQTRHVRHRVTVYTHKQLRSVRYDLGTLREAVAAWQCGFASALENVSATITDACRQTAELRAPELLAQERVYNQELHREMAAMQSHYAAVEAERDSLVVQLADCRAEFASRAEQLKAAHRERETTLELQLKLLSAANARAEAAMLSQDHHSMQLAASALHALHAPPPHAPTAAEMSARPPSPTGSPQRAAAAHHHSAAHYADPIEASFARTTSAALWAERALTERASGAAKLVMVRRTEPASRWQDGRRKVKNESPATLRRSGAPLQSARAHDEGAATAAGGASGYATRYIAELGSGRAPARGGSQRRTASAAR